MNEARDLELLIKSRVPIIAVESEEEQRVLKMAVQIARRLQMKSLKWTITEGLLAIDPRDQPDQAVEQPTDVLGHIKYQGRNAVYLLLDFHHYLQNPVHVRLLKDIAIGYEWNRCTVVLLSYKIELPAELHRFSGHFVLPMPNEEELRNIIYDVAAEWATEHGQKCVQASTKALDVLIRNLAGLTTADARRLARNAIYDDGAITHSDIPAVLKAKYELLNQDGILAFEFETAKFSDVAGLGRLKAWVEQRKFAFHDKSGASRLDPPKGVLLLGVQGCGKSLAAKAISGIFGVPLLRLDFGALYNKYHGETERNLRNSLHMAQVMAPCVLWMDEIEKGLGADDSDSGTSRRVLGTLLTWMAEKDATVFMVATANDIQSLPAELVRKGRFDEIFFVDLPGPDARAEVFTIHLKKRGFHPDAFDLKALAETSNGFSGAEIEQALVSAMYSSRATNQPLSTGLLLAELRQTRPLSVMMAERIEALREWASSRTVPSD